MTKVIFPFRDFENVFKKRECDLQNQDHERK